MNNIIRLLHLQIDNKSDILKTASPKTVILPIIKTIILMVLGMLAVEFALSKIFIPYDVIKFQYPALQKHKWLMPVCQVRRWFRIIFRGGVKRSARELSRNYAITDSEVSKTSKMLEELGLE